MLVVEASPDVRDPKIVLASAPVTEKLAGLSLALVLKPGIMILNLETETAERS
jgi:hypothetical protein